MKPTVCMSYLWRWTPTPGPVWGPAECAGRTCWGCRSARWEQSVALWSVCDPGCRSSGRICPGSRCTGSAAWSGGRSWTKVCICGSILLVCGIFMKARWVENPLRRIKIFQKWSKLKTKLFPDSTSPCDWATKLLNKSSGSWKSSFKIWANMTECLHWMPLWHFILHAKTHLAASSTIIKNPNKPGEDFKFSRPLASGRDLVPAYSWSDRVWLPGWRSAAWRCPPQQWTSWPSSAGHRVQFLAPARSTLPSATGCWLGPWGPVAFFVFADRHRQKRAGSAKRAERVSLCRLFQWEKKDSDQIPTETRIRSQQSRTVMLSKSLAMSLMMSPCWVGWVCSSFLITTTLSATTVSARATEQVYTQHSKEKVCGIFLHSSCNRFKKESH